MMKHYKTTVVNIYKEPWPTSENDVYIGRPSKWGNPFKIGSGKWSRDEVIYNYREWILNQPQLLKELHTLRGKRLGCYCKPLPCHGDVLVELIEGVDKLHAAHSTTSKT